MPGASDLASFPVSSATSIVVGAPLGVYYVRVRAASACGVSAPSNEIVVTVNGAVPLPEAPTGLTTSVAGDVVVVAWTPPLTGGTPAGYRLEAGYAPGASNAAVLVTTVRALRVTGVPRATYYVRVRAFNAAGPGPATPEVVVTVPLKRGQGLAASGERDHAVTPSQWPEMRTARWACPAGRIVCQGRQLSSR